MKRLLISLLIAASIVALGFMIKFFNRVSVFESSKPAKAQAVFENEEVPDEQALSEKSGPDELLDVKKDDHQLGVGPEEIAEKESVAESLDLKPEGLYFQVDKGGLAVADGDIVLGVPTEKGHRGLVKPPQVHTWMGGEIPFIINKDVPHPERIIIAMSYFVDTPIKFVMPQSHHTDILVFQNTEEDCKSYLGRVGGAQPLWVAPSCSSGDIAHEIMHALGFVHEQNRTDRDTYVRVVADNIMPGFEQNFALFPWSMMTVSGSAPFDFGSLMMYPPNSFSKNGQPTLQSKVPGYEILQAQSPNPSDLIRIRKMYGME